MLKHKLRMEILHMEIGVSIYKNGERNGKKNYNGC